MLPIEPTATKRPIIYSTTTGDLLTQTDYGEVTGNSDGTFTDFGHRQAHDDSSPTRRVPVSISAC